MPTKIVWVRSQHGFRPVVVPANHPFPSGGSAIIGGGVPKVAGSNVLYTIVP
jgi:hypothetical protein